MSNPNVLVAIRAHLAAVSGLPEIIWPNEAKAVATPFLTFDNGPQFGTPLTIDGHEAFELRPNIAFHVEQGTYTSEGDAVLWSIAQAFKIGTRIFSGGSEVAQCLQTPVPDGGEPFEGMFRRNLILRIASYQTI